jgi:hypothetical protein
MIKKRFWKFSPVPSYSAYHLLFVFFMLARTTSFGQVLEITMDTPQPRVNTTFQVKIDISAIRRQLFSGFEGKLRLADDMNYREDNMLYFNVIAPETGKFTIGPLNIQVDQKTYSTNALTYEVINALPVVDKGLWFRIVDIDEKSFYLLIEQHIPMHDSISHPAENSTLFQTVPDDNHSVKFTDEHIDGLYSSSSVSSATPRTAEDEKGNNIQFADCFYLRKFTVTDKSKKIKLIKRYFLNLPTDYQFKDIIIN